VWLQADLIDPQWKAKKQGIAVIGTGINAFDKFSPDYAAGVDIIDHHRPEYAQRLCDNDVLAIMFGVILVEGRRGVWRVQNPVFERTGILITDELARVAISQCTQGHKRSNKLEGEMGRWGRWRKWMMLQSCLVMEMDCLRAVRIMLDWARSWGRWSGHARVEM
jgi:hypothetical protein